jgi:hypothetical protein
MSQFPGRSKCPACDRWICLSSDGRFRLHGPRVAPCLSVHLTPDQVANIVLPPLTDEQLDMMRDCYRVGDWRPVELEFGIRMPQYILSGRTPEEELADLLNDVRRWLDTLVELSQLHADGHVP